MGDKEQEGDRQDWTEGLYSRSKHVIGILQHGREWERREEEKGDCGSLSLPNFTFQIVNKTTVTINIVLQVYFIP
jgi:hypothetical protein